MPKTVILNRPVLHSTMSAAHYGDDDVLYVEVHSSDTVLMKMEGVTPEVVRECLVDMLGPVLGEAIELEWL